MARFSATALRYYDILELAAQIGLRDQNIIPGRARITGKETRLILDHSRIQMKQWDLSEAVQKHTY